MYNIAQSCFFYFIYLLSILCSDDLFKVVVCLFFRWKAVITFIGLMDQKYPNHLYWTSSLCENGRYDIAFDVHMETSQPYFG